MRRAAVLLFAMFLWSSIVQAEDTVVSAPIIAVSKGDFFAISPIDGSVKQITNHHQTVYGDQPRSQRDLAISPDSQYLVYLQTPLFFAIAMKNNLVGNIGAAPANVVLMNVSTGEETVIADQQANITYKDKTRLWYRNNLTWSPDGNTLMFVQYRGTQGEPSFDAQVVLYSLLDRTSRVLVELETYASKLVWLSNTTIVAGRGVYDLNGSRISQFYLNEGMTGRYLTHYQGKDYVIVDSADVIPHNGRVYLMDLLTGEHGVVSGFQSSISARTPENSFVFIKDDNDTRPSFVINPKTGDTFTPPKQAPFAVDFTFSPDGQHFAYILLNTSVNISDISGKELVVDLDADTIIWSGKQYTVASKTGDQSAPVTPTNDFYNVRRCGTLPTVGLVAGGQGKVIVGGGANRVRSAPNPDADKLGQIPEGETFTVVDGQQGVCSHAIRWAQIEYQGVTGWTAEGADGKAFLEPVS